MPRLIGENEALEALKLLVRDAGQKIMKPFSTKTYLTRHAQGKLILLSFVTETPKSHIVEKLIGEHLREYEKENGNLTHLAKNKMKCGLCKGEGEIIDKTATDENGYLRQECPKCGGNSK